MFAGLAGAEGLGRWVELRSGRLPRACRPARCEVLRLRGRPGRLPSLADVALVEVGEASLRSRILFGDFLAPTDNALARAAESPLLQQAVQYHRPPPPPLFVAEGTAALAAARSLATTYRSYAWVLPLRAGAPREWEIDGLARDVARARSELAAVTLQFDVTAPVEELRAAQAASRTAGRRLELVGGEAAALLFAFAVLAAAAMRRDIAAARRRLAWYGARVWQLRLLTWAETSAVALAGALAGVAVGLAGGAIAAARAGAPVGAVLAHGPLSPAGGAAVAGVVVAAAVVLAAAVTPRAARVGDLAAVDAAALAAAGLAAVLVATGAADAEEIARGGGTGLPLLVLPGLVTFAAAVAVARLLRPGLRLAERATRGRGTTVRLAAVSLAGNPSYAVVATAFLVVSFALALFAEAYRTTLARSERDQAAFAVPRDFVVHEDLSRLIPVLDAAPLERYRRLAADVDPVVRLGGGVARLEGGTGVTLLGLPPSSLPELRGWRDDTAREPPKELAQRIETPAPARAGVALPAGTLELPVSSHLVTAVVNVEAPRGRFAALKPGERVPAGSRLVAVTLDAATRLQDRGADAGRALAGRAVIGPLRVGGSTVGGAFRGWRGFAGADVRGTPGDTVSVRFTLTNERVTRLRPPTPTDAEPLPVLATPRIAGAAARDGSIAVLVAGEQLPARVVGTVERFPTVRGEAVVADGEALLAALNAARPGAARVNEIWVGTRSEAEARAVAARLSRPPFNVLAVGSRRALEQEARRDPIAHGTLLTLGAAALVALVLALVGILLTVVGDLRDERGELFDLEAQGVGPRSLRALVRLRAATVAVAGLAAGSATGAVLAALVTDLVALTARGGAAEPPLRVAVGWPVVVAAIAAYAALAALLVALATRRAFGGEAPARGIEA